APSAPRIVCLDSPVKERSIATDGTSDSGGMTPGFDCATGEVLFEGSAASVPKTAPSLTYLKRSWPEEALYASSQEFATSGREEVRNAGGVTSPFTVPFAARPRSAANAGNRVTAPDAPDAA
ncbi:unnamed protein product, partial [Polarella glacialis]